ncbi:MAG: DUF3311 domain-containing protein [Bryobacterales bacterium]|nr:DUF3311 domain-containing protein [Bryobacterales bacterium]
MRWFLILLVLAVYLLHQDIWLWRDVRPLVFGFLPVGLAYHIGYMFLVSGLMWILVRCAWSEDEPDGAERHAEDRAG